MSGSQITLNQFKGCLAGVLVGDCLGLPYEFRGTWLTHLEEMEADFDEMKFVKKADRRKYSDDTSMTISVSRFLTETNAKKPLDYKKLAKMFYKSYKNELHPRCYGPHVHGVFMKLEATNFADPFQPASEQFYGEGSLGNGGAMRVAPITLFTIADPDTSRLADITINISRITHTHPVGVAGAIFQALAVRLALLYGKGLETEPAGMTFSPLEFLEALESEFVKETQTREETKNGYEIYLERISTIRKFIQGGVTSWNLQDVRNELGDKVTAAESVPTGLFCFLVAFEDISFLKTDNQFQRTVQLAVALGGDTDTIAAMAGAIAGAYLSFSSIETKFVENCENFEGVLELAKSLYKTYDKQCQKQ